MTLRRCVAERDLPPSDVPRGREQIVQLAIIDREGRLAALAAPPDWIARPRVVPEGVSEHGSIPPWPGGAGRGPKLSEADTTARAPDRNVGLGAEGSSVAYRHGCSLAHTHVV